MADKTHDTIILGAGQAGPALANTLDRRGEKVALIEKRMLGGTCLNDGCRPTKAIRASAKVAYTARTAAAQHGVTVGDVHVDLGEVIARKDKLITNWRSGAEKYFENHESIDVIYGVGRLAGLEGDLKVVDVDGTEYVAPRVIINTGARSTIPPIDGLSDVPVLNSTSILELTKLPDHLLVLGGSYIGLEFGQIFRRFGAQVTIVEYADRLIAREDEDISAAIAEFLGEESVTIRTGVGATRAGLDADGSIALDLSDGSNVTGSHLLVATGRRPNSDDIGLDSVGITPNERGYIDTDRYFETPVPGIYAVGDVNGRGAFTHTAYQDYEILADHLGGGDRHVADRVLTYGLFTDPPLGRVGMTERDARASDRRVGMATFPMAKLTRAVLDGETNGLIKLLVDLDTEEILGAATLGLAGDEIIATISMMMHAGVPYTAFATWLPIHPVVGEFWPTIIQGIAELS